MHELGVWHESGSVDGVHIERSCYTSGLHGLMDHCTVLCAKAKFLAALCVLAP